MSKTTKDKRDFIRDYYAPDSISIEILDDLEAAEAEVKRLREQTQWRPIETAPKDKPLLLGRFWRNALWDKNEPSVFFQWTGSWEDRSLDKSGCSSDWAEYHGLQPTHWMPLPQPPQEQESERE